MIRNKELHNEIALFFYVRLIVTLGSTVKSDGSWWVDWTKWTGALDSTLSSSRFNKEEEEEEGEEEEEEEEAL